MQQVSCGTEPGGTRISPANPVGPSLSIGERASIDVWQAVEKCSGRFQGEVEIRVAIPGRARVPETFFTAFAGTGNGCDISGNLSAKR